MKKQSVISYQINDGDEIVFVSDSWDEFARANDSAHLVSQNVLGKSIWNFISDAATEQLYREIIKRARGGQTIEFYFRCDAPDVCRFLKMIIKGAEKGGGAAFETRTLREWKRQPQKLLQAGADERRAREILRICGWCKKIDVGKNDWQEVEKAVVILGLFDDGGALPRLSHGMCAGCYESVSAKLQRK